jgi:hypothetical protein
LSIVNSSRPSSSNDDAREYDPMRPPASGQSTEAPPVPSPTGAPVTSAWREPRAVSEKKVLICLLAMREAERRGITMTSAEVQQTSDDFRIQFGLVETDESIAWMRSAGLDEASYTRFMCCMTAVRLVQVAMKTEIEGLMDLYLRVESARHR